MSFNSTEFAWCDMTVTAMGRPYERILKIKYGIKEGKKYIYGRGKKVKGIQPGRETPDGEMEIGQSEYTAMLKRARSTNPRATIRDISIDIQVHFLKGTDFVKNKVVGVEFPGVDYDIKEGDSDMVIKLPFMMMDVLEDI